MISMLNEETRLQSRGGWADGKGNLVGMVAGTYRLEGLVSECGRLGVTSGWGILAPRSVVGS